MEEQIFTVIKGISWAGVAALGIWKFSPMINQIIKVWISKDKGDLYAISEKIDDHIGKGDDTNALLKKINGNDLVHLELNVNEMVILLRRIETAIKELADRNDSSHDKVIEKLNFVSWSLDKTK